MEECVWQQTVGDDDGDVADDDVADCDDDHHGFCPGSFAYLSMSTTGLRRTRKQQPA